MTAEQRLPRTIADRVHYQLTLKAYQAEWTATYEYNGQIFSHIVAHGDSIESALKDMLFLFERHSAFVNIRHLLNQEASV